jgi:hypothetical protein
MLANMFQTMTNLLLLYLDRTTLEQTWWIKKENRTTFDKERLHFPLHFIWRSI